MYVSGGSRKCPVSSFSYSLESSVRVLLQPPVSPFGREVRYFMSTLILYGLNVLLKVFCVNVVTRKSFLSSWLLSAKLALVTETLILLFWAPRPWPSQTCPLESLMGLLVQCARICPWGGVSPPCSGGGGVSRRDPGQSLPPHRPG